MVFFIILAALAPIKPLSAWALPFFSPSARCAHLSRCCRVAFKSLISALSWRLVA